MSDSDSDNVKCAFVEPQEAGYVMSQERLQTYIVNNSHMLWMEAVKIRTGLYMIAALLAASLVASIVVATMAIIMVMAAAA